MKKFTVEDILSECKDTDNHEGIAVGREHLSLLNHSKQIERENGPEHPVTKFDKLIARLYLAL